jgi:hypothetical protein
MSSGFQHDAFQGDAFQQGALVVAGGDVSLTPGVGSLTLTGQAPTARVDLTVAPGLGTLTLSGLAVTVTASATATPGAGSLTLTGLAATVTASATLAPNAGSLALTGLALTVSASHEAAPGAGSLALTGFAPSVSATGADVTVEPGTGSLTLAGYAPEIDDGIPDAGGADPDGAGIRNVFKAKKRRVLNPEDIKVPKSVEQELEDYLDSLKAKPPRAKVKPQAKLKAKVAGLTDEEREAMAYWALQEEIDAEDEDIIMLLLAA